MKSAKQLRAKRSPVNIRLRSGQTPELMAIAMALQAGLRTVLEELAVLHDFEEGPWLDDLERVLINDASNIWSQGVPIDAELRALDSGRDHMQALVAALRRQLRHGSEGRTRTHPS